MYETITRTERYKFIRAVKKLPGLLGYYPMNELSGTVCRNIAPANKNTKNGVINGSMSLGNAIPKGRVGRGCRGDGTTAYVDQMGIALYNNGTNKFSVGFIVYNSSWTSTNSMRLYSEGRLSSITPEYILGQGGVGSERKLNLLIRTDGSTTSLNGNTSSDVLVDGTPQLIILSDNNGTVKCYVNGTEVAGTNFNYSRGGLTLDRIGFMAMVRNTTTNFFNGYMQHAFLTNTALTAAQALKLAQVAGFA